MPGRYQDVKETDPLLGAGVESGALYTEVNASGREDDIMAYPKDKFNFVYLSFYFLGLGTLLPWNFFITANDYWMFKLQSNGTNASTSNVTPDPNAEPNSSTPAPAVQLNQLQTLFPSTLSVCAMLPNVIFQFLNTVLQQRIREKVRILGSLVFMILLFVVTEIFVKIDTSSWRELFFSVTMICVVILNCSSAIFQSSVFGISASLPPRYTQAVMAGQGMGGVFASLAMIGALAYSSDPTSSAFAYFMTAIVVLFLTGVCYSSLRNNKFFAHHRSSGRSSSPDHKEDHKLSRHDEGEILCENNDHKLDHPTNEHEDAWVKKESIADQKSIEDPLTGDSVHIIEPNNVPPLWLIFKQIWLDCFLVIFTFFVTLACFPSVTANVRSMTSGYTWNDIYFTPVCCFLLFNFCDWVGRSMAGYIHVPSKNSRAALVICVLSRGAFLALFALCNVQPRNTPVIFTNDIFFIIFMVLFGISNGHLSTLVMQYGPLQVSDPEHASTAGSMLAFSISVGLSLGAGFSFVLRMAI
uniref:Equilibrative nucleoside transporter 1 n=1 Tax=Phallusia mammillata TaxID=59560 RepID=A0A6F9DRY2_9ASCI|nr:equilibrative nucleoside transporter 1 [Phallusia mammillata]